LFIRKRFHVCPADVFRSATKVGSILALGENAPKEEKQQLMSNIVAIDNYYNAHIVKRNKKQVIQRDLFDHDFLFFPVNDGNAHWYSVVVINPLKVNHPTECCWYMVFNGCHSTLQEKTGIRWLLNRCWIYGKHNGSDLSKLKRTDMDHQGKTSGPFDDKERFRQLFVNPKEFVGQADDCSCGVFVCLYALQFICSQLCQRFELNDMVLRDGKYYVPPSYNFMALLQTPGWSAMNQKEKAKHELQLSTRF
jgi:Ulp1 protease family, C-terminal catalytic domain